MRKVAIINSLDQALDIADLIDAYMVPVNKFSINYEPVFELSEIKKLCDLNKEIFVIVNKNIHNNELDELEKLLTNLDSLNINGIVFYDVAIVNLKKKLGLKTDLVWAQEHMTTNYETINYWYEQGSKYAYLSSELTKQEIMDIKTNSKARLFMNVFGHIPMFTSRRHLVNNYIEYFELDDRKGQKRIYKEEKYYPILDGVNGTTVYSDYILNALDEEFIADYLVFNSYLISDEDFKDTLINYDKNGPYKFPFSHGFLYKETVYKVKNNE